MAAILVNKFFHEMNGSANVSLEPLDEVFFNKHPMLRTVEKIFERMKKSVEKTMAWANKDDEDKLNRTLMYTTTDTTKMIKPILCTLFGLQDASITVESDKKSLGNINMGIVLGGFCKLNEPEIDYDIDTKSLSNKYIDYNSYYDIIEKDAWDLSSNKTQPLSLPYKVNGKNITHVSQKAADQIEELSRKAQEALYKDYPDLSKLIVKANGYNHILLIDKDGIRVDPKRVSAVAHIVITPRFVEIFSPRIMTAALLHELGHLFYQLLTKPTVEKLNFKMIQLEYYLHNNPRHGKHAEMFADQFATMYGYGQDLTEFFMVMNAIRLDKEDLSDVDNFNKLLKQLDSRGDEHPPTLVRINNVINQMKRDLADPDLDERKKRSLLAIIKQIRNKIDKFKEKNFLMYKFARELAQLEYDAIQSDPKYNDTKKYRKGVAPRITNKFMKDLEQIPQPPEKKTTSNIKNMQQKNAIIDELMRQWEDEQRAERKQDLEDLIAYKKKIELKLEKETSPIRRRYLEDDIEDTNEEIEELMDSKYEENSWFKSKRQQYREKLKKMDRVSLEEYYRKSQ